ncbi:MAG: SDR family oxidoreductase [Pseudomonadota bacterium]
MNLKDKCIVVTGAATGIGRALTVRFAAEGAAHVICADIDEAGATGTAALFGGTAIKADIGSDAGVKALVDAAEAIAPVDLFCSNAGIMVAGGPEASDEDWTRIMDINVMSHIWAARHLVPKMIERGGGYFLNTSSAAGLLNQVGAMPYGVTKHAAIGAAEWLAFTYADQGIKVSVLCPQAVDTDMIRGHEDGVASIDGVATPEDVAEACVEAIEAETFLVLPHPKVADYIKLKAGDYDRWIGGMKKLNRVYGERK